MLAGWHRACDESLAISTANGAHVLLETPKSGNPNGGQLPVWPRYSRASDVIVNFAEDGTVVPQKDPLDRDLRRRQLAQRLVMHQARTKTIFFFTGLSRHQMATLRRRWRIGGEMRRRGPPPTSFNVLLSTSRMRAETAALAVFWKALGSVRGASNVHVHGAAFALDLGERLCDVFDVYLACFPNTELEPEHLVLLARGLEEASSIGLEKCSSCKAVMLIDPFGGLSPERPHQPPEFGSSMAVGACQNGLSRGMPRELDGGKGGTRKRPDA